VGALGGIHRAVEFDQHVAGFHLLAVVDMNRTNDPSLERLDHFGAYARNNLTGGCSDNVDIAEAGPQGSCIIASSMLDGLVG
jgi:hypothetical protein